MESIGDILSQTRKNNNYSVEQAARDTHIAKRFLQALEEEDYAVFPGEAYIIGFLRNYAEYLGLDPEQLVDLYKNTKLQEQPAPMNELLEANSKPKALSIALLVVIVVVVVAAIGVIGYRYVYPRLRDRNARVDQEMPASVERPDVYLFQEEVAVRWFEETSVIRFMLGEGEHDFEITSIGQSAGLRTPNGPVTLARGEERVFDLDSDGVSDIRIVLNDIDRSTELKRASLGLYKITAANVAPEPVREERQTLGADVYEPPIRMASYSPKVVLGAVSPYGFTAELTFRAYALCRYLVDGKDRQERFFQRDDSVSLEAERELKVWFSNSGAARLRVEGIETEIGRAGEIATRLIKWVKDEGDSGYQLKVLPQY